MKQITNKTILKQGDREFQPIEVDSIIYWSDNSNTGEIDDYVTNGTHIGKINVLTIDDPNIKYCSKILAQSQPKHEGVPVISLDNYVEKLGEDETNIRILKHKTPSQIARQYFDGFIEGYKSNPNQFTLKDIEKAIELAQMVKDYGDYKPFTKEEILEQINSISVIEVDDQFNILSYK
jgi:hypothetical protein